MERYIPFRRQVSPSPSPNRTCGFPRIRLSMHGRWLAHGWASGMPEAGKCGPEVTPACAMLVLLFRIPSVRFLDKLGRVASGPTFGEQAQAIGPFGPLPPFSRGAEVVAPSQPRPRRISVLPLQPAPDALPYPEVEMVGLAAIRAGTAMGSATSNAYSLGRTTSGASGMAGVAAGIGGVARAGSGAILQGGRSMVQRAGSSLTESAHSSENASAQPAWAQRLQSEQRGRHHRQIIAQTIKEGDRPGAPANPDLDQRED